MDMPTLSLTLRVALILVLLPVLFVGASLAWNHPPLLDAPGIGTRLKTYLTTHIAETRENHPFPELRPHRFAVPPEVLFRFSQQVVSDMGWSVSGVEPTAYQLTSVATTGLWRFKDNVTLRVYTSPDGGSILYVRSESQVGKGDLGANIRRVLDVTHRIERQIAEHGRRKNN